MDIQSIAQEIMKHNKELEVARNSIKQRGNGKAEAKRDYDRAMAVTMASLANGMQFDLDGVPIEKPPATIMERLAKGICSEQGYLHDIADAGWKGLLTYINTLQTSINSLQTLYKNQTEV